MSTALAARSERRAARATPDGYTLIIGHMGTHAAAPALYPDVAYAKANQSKLNMAHAGVGSVSYVACLLLNTAIGIKPTLVPFTGSAPATNALMAGQVDYFCDPVIGQLAQISAGNVHALAIAAAARHPLLADVPTAAEEGLPQFNIAPFFALFGPKGTPQSVID